MRMNTRRRFDEPSLQYELSSTPSPLQASPADSTKPLATAELIVIASNPNRAPANVASVSISFDVATAGDPDDARYLTSIGTGIGFEVMGDSHQTMWTVTDDGAGTFTASAKAGSVPIVGQGLAFLISNIRPNRSVGTFELTISETLVGGTANEIVLQDSKFPFEFTLDNFRADESSVAQDHPTTLRWDGGVGAKLEIFHSGTSTNVTGKNDWLTGDLTQDSEFVLQASIGTVAIATWSLTVEVADQILELTSLTVEQATILRGGATVDNAMLVANAGATISGGAGNAALAVHGGTSIDGPVSLFGAPQILQINKSYTPMTDGLVVGQLQAPPSGACSARLTISDVGSPPIVATYVGGATLGRGQYQQLDNAVSATYPARKGQQFSVGFSQPPSETPAYFYVVWVPFGTGGPGPD